MGQTPEYTFTKWRGLNNNQTTYNDKTYNDNNPNYFVYSQNNPQNDNNENDDDDDDVRKHRR